MHVSHLQQETELGRLHIKVESRPLGIQKPGEGKKGPGLSGMVYEPGRGLESATKITAIPSTSPSFGGSSVLIILLPGPNLSGGGKGREEVGRDIEEGTS